MKLYLTPLILLFLISCHKEKKTTTPPINNPFYDMAFEYRENDKSDSAFLYFNKAKDLFLQQKDSLGAGKCLVNMAIISTDKGDYFDGQEISIDALLYLKNSEEKHLPYIKSNLNNLGITSSNLKNYDQAINFYEQSLIYTRDTSAILVIQNNIANAYRNKKEYNKALQLYSIILKRGIKDQTEYARTLTNIAVTRWLQTPGYNAAPYLLTALNIRKQENDFRGLNSSYAHLTDYYAKNKPDSALLYAVSMYQTAKIINSIDDRLEALQKLIKLSPPKETKHFFSIYEALNDSIQTARNTAKNQFALIRYETEKSKADNLVLQKDINDKKYQIIILAFGILVIIIAGSFWYRKRKQKLELKAQNAIIKTSQKVHDVVANGLYRIMNKLDSQEVLKDDPIINEIEELYEQSRDISYEKPALTKLPFHEKISNLLKSFASETTKVVLVGNSPLIWEKVTDQAKYELEHILQELMVNMGKHSQASNVVIKFEQQANQVDIFYTDNGVGISGNPQPKNGLTNTGNRMEHINGTITFDTNVEKGLKIKISFPVS